MIKKVQTHYDLQRLKSQMETKEGNPFRSGMSCMLTWEEVGLTEGSDNNEGEPRDQGSLGYQVQQTKSKGVRTNPSMTQAGGKEDRKERGKCIKGPR